jgi:hypothetical protein
VQGFEPGLESRFDAFFRGSLEIGEPLQKLLVPQAMTRLPPNQTAMFLNVSKTSFVKIINLQYPPGAPHAETVSSKDYYVLCLTNITLNSSSKI